MGAGPTILIVWGVGVNIILFFLLPLMGRC
eukprot:SAG22_NODE_7088_length_778_cov_1.160530_2_plen_29_part_01